MQPAIIYLHGFASGPGSSKAQVFRRRFAGNGLSIAIPDLNEGGFENLTLTGQLRVIERVAGGRRVSLIGSSMGGYLAALYAARHSEVDRLVLMAPAFCFARRWAEMLGPDRLEQWRTAGRLEVFHYGYSQPRGVGWGLMQDAWNYEDFPEFEQPALVFHGTEDSVVPASFSEQLAGGRPNVRLKLLPSDHQLLDCIEEICDDAGCFLGASGPPASSHG